MRHAIGLAILFVARVTWSAEPAPTVDAAIDRSLEFLTDGGEAWKTVRQCGSCHHGPMLVWTLREAQQRGRMIEQPVLDEQFAWLHDPQDSAKMLAAAETDAVKMLSLSAAYLRFATNESGAATTPEFLTRYATHVAKWQTAEGSWTSPAGRPPLFLESPETTTLFVLASLPSKDLAEPLVASRDRALAWLKDHNTETSHQSQVLRLLAEPVLQRGPEAVQATVQQLRELQRLDGGWAQIAERSSDAFATGQTLVALQRAGVVVDDPAILRAREFLRTTQREDGSWAMTSRPVPGKVSEGANNTAPIEYAATAWATIALLRTGK